MWNEEAAIWGVAAWEEVEGGTGAYECLLFDYHTVAILPVFLMLATMV